MRLWLILGAVIISLLGLGAAAMPESFYTAMGRIPNIEVICVKNYQVGASITEAYGNFEYLNKETQIVSRTYNGTEDCGEDCRERAILEASISSEGIGQAHLAWQSMNPIHGDKGHHALIGRSVEEMTGVFSIEKLIQLWPNSTAANVTSLNWLPCP
ncbi:MAG: hypothetical protein LUQ38_08920 [Methanotrichaceae archaeon]|nr:hypothetical protein [Methanotrichaceae archaeon]